MTPSLRITAAGLMLAAVMAGCSPPAEKAVEAGPSLAATADIHPFRIGQLQAVALKDDDGSPIPNTAGVSPYADTSAVAEVLAANGRSALTLSIQPLLVRDGVRIVLLDAGAGGEMGTQNKLLASLRAAGVNPSQVTDVLISHMHDDHVGGLVNAEGQLVFPNAIIRISAEEWAHARRVARPGGAGRRVAVIAPRVQTFQSGVQVTPSITAVALDGHTPGHAGYEIVSGDDRLLYFGDALHSSTISVQRPELVNGWDFNSDAAIATRQNVLARGATQSLRVYGGHFPFPGVGRFQRRDDGFVWVPETTAQP